MIIMIMIMVMIMIMIVAAVMMNMGKHLIDNKHSLVAFLRYLLFDEEASFKKDGWPRAAE